MRFLPRAFLMLYLGISTQIASAQTPADSDLVLAPRLSVALGPNYSLGNIYSCLGGFLDFYSKNSITSGYVVAGDEFCLAFCRDLDFLTEIGVLFGGYWENDKAFIPYQLGGGVLFNREGTFNDYGLNARSGMSIKVGEYFSTGLTILAHVNPNSTALYFGFNFCIGKGVI